MEEPTFIEECKEALGSNTVVLSKQESDKKWEIFEQELPITTWGRIDWDKLNKKVIINSVDNLIPALGRLLDTPIDPIIYIFWNEASLPVLQTDIYSAVEAFDDLYIGIDIWFLNLSQKYVFERFHEGELVVGLF